MFKEDFHSVLEDLNLTMEFIKMAALAESGLSWRQIARLRDPLKHLNTSEC